MVRRRVTGLLVPPEGIWITIWCISLSHSKETKTPPHPPRWRMVTTCWLQAWRPQTGWNQKVEIPQTSPPTNQKKVHELIMHPMTLTPNNYFKNPCLKATGEFRSFEHELPILLAWCPANKPWLCCKYPLSVWLSVPWAQETLPGNNSTSQSGLIIFQMLSIATCC